MPRLGLALPEGHMTENFLGIRLGLGGGSRTGGGGGIGNNCSLWLAQQREGTDLALTPRQHCTLSPCLQDLSVPRELSFCPYTNGL